MLLPPQPHQSCHHNGTSDERQNGRSQHASQSSLAKPGLCAFLVYVKQAESEQVALLQTCQQILFPICRMAQSLWYLPGVNSAE
jgi:hypothetical protein